MIGKPIVMMKLKHAFHGMTLNAMGRLYGVERKRREGNMSYEWRILKYGSTHLPKTERSKNT